MKRKKKLSLRLNTVYKKIVFLTLSCSLLPLIITSCISYYMAYSISKDRTIDSIRSVNKQTAIHISNRMEQIESLSNTLSFYLYSLYKTPLQPLSGYLQTYAQSKKNIGSVKNAFELFQVSIFLPEHCFIDTAGNGIDFFPLNKLGSYAMTEKELFSAGSRSFWRINKDLQFPEAFSARPKTVLTCWNAYRNLHSGSLNYAFACHIRLAEFSVFLDPPLKGSGISSFVIDRENRILIHSRETELGTVFTPGQADLWNPNQTVLTWDQTLLVTQSFKNDTLLLVTQIPLSYLRQNSSFVLTFLLLTSLSIIICSVLLSVLASKTFTHRIWLLSAVMESTTETSDRSGLQQLSPMLGKPADAKDEIDRLADTFQEMTLERDHFFTQLLHMSLQTEKLKYQLLQSQISPHFLFNTLNAIISCQSLGKFDLAQQTITNLSRFYRELLHDPDTLIPIEEELRITELYLNLICVSKPNPISWEFDVESGAEHFYICKFVFQPFMENAVIHAIATSASALHIRIAISYMEHDALLIQISDNGIGMEASVQRQLLETLSSRQADYQKHFGIGNVNVRLIPYFAENWKQIRFESTPGSGTCFTILLKQLLEAEEKE